jgi:hypothetical protein
MDSKKKIEAIYKLRQAAEQKARAERDLEEKPTAEARDALLDAQLELEKSTYNAIEVCHECGHEHAPGAAHVTRDSTNVIELRNRADRTE